MHSSRVKCFYVVVTRLIGSYSRFLSLRTRSRRVAACSKFKISA